MKEEILEALSKPYIHTIKDINKLTKIKRIDIEDMLIILIKDGYVYKIDNRYYLRKKGTIQIKDRGFGFIMLKAKKMIIMLMLITLRMQRMVISLIFMFYLRHLMIFWIMHV